MTDTQSNNKTSRQIIWDAIVEMDSLGQAISRQRLVEVTRLSFHVIDDHVSRMIEVDGTLRRVVSGVFEVVRGYMAPRVVSFADLDDGQTLIEVGDQQLRVWPRELRIIGLRTSGNAQQFAALQMQHDVGMMGQEQMLQQVAVRREQAARIKQLEDENIALKKRNNEMAVRGGEVIDAQASLL
ncbi:hypothetical protein COAQ111491_14160 [Comamonas aquatilis]